MGEGARSRRRRRRVEFDLVEKDACVPVVDADRVAIVLTRAEAGDIKLPIGTEDEAVRAIEMSDLALLVQVIDKHAEEIKRLRVKDQDLAAETERGRPHIRQAGNIKEAVRADDQTARMKVDGEGKVFGEGVGIKLTEELAGPRVVSEEAARGKVAERLIGNAYIGGINDPAPIDYAVTRCWMSTT